jgi:hypothetical protein
MRACAAWMSASDSDGAFGLLMGMAMCLDYLSCKQKPLTTEDTELHRGNATEVIVDSSVVFPLYDSVSSVVGFHIAGRASTVRAVAAKLVVASSRK